MDNPIPLFSHSLSALANVLAKAEAHAAERRIDPAVLFAARLFPDMLPMGRQVMIASDHAKAMAARLTGRENPRFEDTETSFAELRARIGKTLDFMQSVPAEDFAGADTRPIHVKAGGRELDFAGADYLRHWAIPNFFFHVTTAYNILRHNGVPLGKADFLGG
jgi:hypothetical protein